MKIPLSFEEIVDEVNRFTGLPKDEVGHRTWMEALNPGWNVLKDVTRYGITPFTYNEKMNQLYMEGDCFIFDCLVFWSKPIRQRWIEQAAERIELFCKKNSLSKQDVRILMLGDGPGNDSLYLASRGFPLEYYDVPGSKTYRFALERFQYYGFLNKCIHTALSYEQCLRQTFDVVLCFEVLEHLPDPVRSIGEIAQMLKQGGIALITEDFGDSLDYLPTHLKVNDRLLGKTSFIFMKNGMRLSWYSKDPLFKPYEFSRQETVNIRDWLQVLGDNRLRGRLLYTYSRKITGLINRIIYWGKAC